jgi:hypothetical protein
MKAILPPCTTVACVYMPSGLSPGGLMNFFAIVVPPIRDRLFKRLLRSLRESDRDDRDAVTIVTSERQK